MWPRDVARISLRDLLARVGKRPGMYLGGDLSWETLRAYLAGYKAALQAEGTRTTDPTADAFFTGFDDHVRDRLGADGRSLDGLSHLMLQDRSQPADAFTEIETFFADWERREGDTTSNAASLASATGGTTE